jgi:hypothetical protein
VTYTVSRKFGTIGGPCYFAKYSKIEKGDVFRARGSSNEINIAATGNTR